MFPVVQGCLQHSAAAEQVNLVHPGAASRAVEKTEGLENFVSLCGQPSRVSDQALEKTAFFLLQSALQKPKAELK